MKTGLFFLILITGASSAYAELSCGQLGVVAETTVSLRDQGYSLQQVLEEMSKLEKTHELTAEEIQLLKNVVNKSFTRELSQYEIVKNCNALQGK